MLGLINAVMIPNTVGIMLSVIMLGVNVLSVITIRGVMLIIILLYAECCSAECHCAECRGAAVGGQFNFIPILILRRGWEEFSRSIFGSGVNTIHTFTSVTLQS